MAKLDEERKTFNFHKVLMINPAVSLFNSVSRIDGLLDRDPRRAKENRCLFQQNYGQVCRVLPHGRLYRHQRRGSL